MPPFSVSSGTELTVQVYSASYACHDLTDLRGFHAKLGAPPPPTHLGCSSGLHLVTRQSLRSGSHQLVLWLSVRSLSVDAIPLGQAVHIRLLILHIDVATDAEKASISWNPRCWRLISSLVITVKISPRGKGWGLGRSKSLVGP